MVWMILFESLYKLPTSEFLETEKDQTIPG